jgi:quercetin dioxygenase-like cupin family protein
MQGMSGQVIWSDGRAHISELAFSRRGIVTPHTNPNTTLFIVVSGGGFVQVGEERIRINHGEAVVWPPDIPHGAYTDGVEMRAIVVELLGLEPAEAPLLEGHAEAVGDGPPGAWRTDAPDGGPGASAGAAPGDSGAGRGVAPDAGPAGTRDAVEPARGSLAEPELRPETYDSSEGEPW